MLKYCRDKWEENKDKLEKALREANGLNDCEYKELVVMVVKYILNPGEHNYDTYDSKNITVIDNGDYQGTQLFMIPADTYQPEEVEKIITRKIEYLIKGYSKVNGVSLEKFISDRTDGIVSDTIDKNIKSIFAKKLAEMI